MTLTASFNIFWLDTRIEGLDLPKKTQRNPSVLVYNTGCDKVYLFY